MDKVLIIYHDVDFDGKCSAAIAAGAFEDADFYGWSHYREIDWQLIEQYNMIIMVDIAFPEQQDMERLDSIADFIWIDHHKISIDKYKHLALLGKYETGTDDYGKGAGNGACQLCWEYFFPHLELPRAVRLLADYDVWNHEDIHTLPFQYGMRYYDVKASDSKLWKELFKNDDGDLFTSILDAGTICHNYQTSQNEYLAKHSFEMEFEGYKCIALNGGGGSLVFESVNGRSYDIMITFSFTGKFWSVSMYNDNGKVNVGEIAKKYGGGGHIAASGFKSEKFPFPWLKA